MKSFFRFALLALMLLVVALLSALTAMRLAIHGREVAVPDLTRKTPAEARKIAEQSGLHMDVERHITVPTCLPGMFSRNCTTRHTGAARLANPRRGEPGAAAGGDSKRGWAERACGRDQHRAPRLNVGAIARLEFPDATPGEVVSQAPPSNASSVSAPKISLLVSEPWQPQSFVMPNFVGQPLGSVTLAFARCGISIGSRYWSVRNCAGSSARSPASIIVSQNPAAGAKVMAGSQ